MGLRSLHGLRELQQQGGPVDGLVLPGCLEAALAGGDQELAVVLYL